MQALLVLAWGKFGYSVVTLHTNSVTSCKGDLDRSCHFLHRYDFALVGVKSDHSATKG